MNNSVIKGAGYVLVHVPGMVMYHGATQTTERVVNPDSEYLKELPKHMRSYEQCVAYPPNQTYIGNLPIEELAALPEPWVDKTVEGAARYGKFGEIMPEAEFIILLQVCDAFDLVHLDKDFVKAHRADFEAHPLMTDAIKALVKEGVDAADVLHFTKEEAAEEIVYEDKVVGYVKRAHDVDVNLSAHVMFENIVAKASGVLSILHMLKNTGISPADVEYVIDCCEEACGDMNQRGGGNFAKAEAEIAGLINATGSDARGFCAGPAHAMVEAASLVKAGTYKNVVVVGGGCTAKLGMNGKDHVKKDLPILEDCLGGFAILVSENDGKSPEINLEVLGRHTVGTGSAPQNVIQALVTDPLAANGMTILDVDKFSPEMQNPDITKPAGAGDVPEANYKMIAALGVKLGQLEKTQLASFVKEHGLKGYAPTQGHIPSGVPYIGYARESIMAGKTKNAMIIGKGSLFLGRMTNLFDGVSFLIQANTKTNAPAAVVSTGKQTVIGIAAEGTELGRENLETAVALAAKKGVKAVIVEGENCHAKMEEMLASGEIDAAVASHYPFPIGVSTVGRLVTPALGKEMFLANTTGTSHTDRVACMVLNTVAGIIAAKACGIENPTVGIANVEGARQAEKALNELKAGGYAINFAESSRADGGAVMRGNDLLKATSDVMVMDPLTGNLMMKLFSAFTTGGSFESTGYGYGPGIGAGYNKLILIISRASGAPVIANACEYAAQLVNAGWVKIAKEEYAKAKRAGLDRIIDDIKASHQTAAAPAKKIEAPAKETCTYDIHGIEVTDIEDAVASLWEAGIYAESGMGCTGPVVMINDAKKEAAEKILREKKYIM
ncbi:MAG: glycine/sarcosine/betaine reductase complex component C subunit beta [Synergistaceae bacterium]|nr:glycine/sarcosine/betaine reductase complex component C subunit beta [Synergistaceae bacterium]